MKIVVEVKRFREEYFPDEDRYEHHIVIAIGGEDILVPLTEEQLKEAVREYDQIKKYGEQPSVPETPGMPVEEDPVHDHIAKLCADNGLTVDDLTDEDYQSLYDKFYEQLNPPEEGHTVDPPQIFHGADEATEYLDQMQHDLEDPVSGEMTSDPMAESLLGEDLPQDMFGEPEEPQEPEQPRRDMTPGHKKRKKTIAQRHEQGRLVSTRQQKIQELRARAKALPRRKVASTELGYPDVPAARPSPQHSDGNGPTVRVHQPAPIGNVDEDGFPSA